MPATVVGNGAHRRGVFGLRTLGRTPGWGIHLRPLPDSTDPQGEGGKRGPPAFQKKTPRHSPTLSVSVSPGWLAAPLGPLPNLCAAGSQGLTLVLL